MSQTLGKTLRILRQAKGLTVSEAARCCKVSVSFLSLVENDARQPSLSVLRRFASNLNVPCEALLVLAMGGEASSNTKDNAAARIATTVQQLIAIEDKLRELLTKKESRGAGAKGR